MDDYISREALIDRLSKNLSACNPGTFSEMCYAYAIETVKHLPAADVAPVVRCKDCRYWGDEAGVAVRTDGVRFARCKVHNLCVSGERVGWCPAEDDFCSQGERRTDNENR